MTTNILFNSIKQTFVELLLQAKHSLCWAAFQVTQGEHIPSPQETLPSPLPPINLVRSKWRERVRRNMITNNCDIKLEWVHYSRRGTNQDYGSRDSQQPRFASALSGQSRPDLGDQPILISLVMWPWFSSQLPEEVLSSGSTESYGVQVGMPAYERHTKVPQNELASSCPDRPPCSTQGYDFRLWL